MATPKQRHTKSRRNRRRSHHALTKQGLSVCPKCKEPILPHQLCRNCGVYAGREVVDVLAKLTKKEKKKKVKEIADQEKEQTQEKGMTMEDMSQK
ncbi:MAG: 50S ribosomal protein L32 [Parcubacteria group bacterium]|jgi:large subunit ribosomal protein L32|nr:50S ribosomal protein L32 [Parcubacteria group bacterium]|tara:strand:- start:5032 stop:5316 length:285 start_codon:yes stop_codon:yes gene_type:complete